jgi:hypothetical protein
MSNTFEGDKMDRTAEEFIGSINEMTGKTLEEIELLYKQSKLTKHSEIRTLFMGELQISYGFANTLVHVIAKTDGTSLAEGKDMPALLDDIYSGKKEQLRPVHDLIMSKIDDFGDFETLPKKGYLSLKRKRQFAMIGPKTNTYMEIGINLKEHLGTARLIEQPKGSMCKFIVKIESIDEVDTELITWLQEAFEQAK